MTLYHGHQSVWQIKTVALECMYTNWSRFNQWKKTSSLGWCSKVYPAASSTYLLGSPEHCNVKYSKIKVVLISRQSSSGNLLKLPRDHLVAIETIIINKYLCLISFWFSHFVYGITTNHKNCLSHVKCNTSYRKTLIISFERYIQKYCFHITFFCKNVSHPMTSN